jgi:hypothetical protein
MTIIFHGGMGQVWDEPLHELLGLREGLPDVFTLCPNPDAVFDHLSTHCSSYATSLRLKLP